MRLYPRNPDVYTVHDARGDFEVGPDGGFDFPDDLARYLNTVVVRGVKQWETSIERQRRLMREEADRRKDPATLLAAVEQLVAASRNHTTT